MRRKNVKSKIWPGIKFSFSICHSARKIIPFLCGAAVILRVALPYLSIMTPKIVLDQIENNAAPERFLIVVGGIALILVAINYLKAFTDTIVDRVIGIVSISSVLQMQNSRELTMDYELMDDPDYKVLEDKAYKVTGGNHAPAMNILKYVVELASSSAGFLLYSGAIVLIHPLILILLLVSTAVNWLMLSRARRYMESTRDERSKYYRRLAALNETLRKPESAKDIRLYGAFGWLYGVYKSQYALHQNAERAVLTKNMHAQLTDALMVLLRDGAAYAFLIGLVLTGKMSLGEFVFVFAAIGALAGWASGILNAASDLSKACADMSDIRNALDYPDRMNTGAGIPLPSAGELPPSIELRGVSYKYPNAEKQTLSDINIKIDAGERIAIVGVNGAGKTTLVKLICGLFSPTAGEVLLNGKPVSAFNRDEYYTLFSAVFQDIHMMPSSIAENIAQRPPEEIDRGRVSRCLDLTGLKAKTDTLPLAEDTLLVRAVHPEAAELSGGEKQRLAMARALYKDAPVLILDEPTAALDPELVGDVLTVMRELAQDGMTMMVVTHEMAFARDVSSRTIFMDGGVIVEQGRSADVIGRPESKRTQTFLKRVLDPTHVAELGETER